MGAFEVEVERSEAEKMCLSWRSSLDEITEQVESNLSSVEKRMDKVGKDAG